MNLLRITIISLNIFLSIVIFGCSSPEYSQTKDIKDAQWHITDTAHFDVDISNNQMPRNIFIELTHEDDYSYGNIFLFSDIVFPDGKTIKDTLQYILINPNYEWAGKGMGSKTLKFPYKQNVSFPTAGKYRFKICQAMRVGNDSILAGIDKITLTIE